jgi:hypothetical protein
MFEDSAEEQRRKLDKWPAPWPPAKREPAAAHLVPWAKRCAPCEIEVHGLRQRRNNLRRL